MMEGEPAIGSSGGMCWGYSQIICPVKGTEQYEELCRFNQGTTNNGDGKLVR